MHDNIPHCEGVFRVTWHLKSANSNNLRNHTRQRYSYNKKLTGKTVLIECHQYQRPWVEVTLAAWNLSNICQNLRLSKVTGRHVHCESASISEMVKHRQVVDTDTHTHTFNDPLSGTTQVSRYQKGKTNLDFTEARDSEWQWNQLGHTSLHLAPDR